MCLWSIKLKISPPFRLSEVNKVTFCENHLRVTLSTHYRPSPSGTLIPNTSDGCLLKCIIIINIWTTVPNIYNWPIVSVIETVYMYNNKVFYSRYYNSGERAAYLSTHIKRTNATSCWIFCVTATSRQRHLHESDKYWNSETRLKQHTYC